MKPINHFEETKKQLDVISPTMCAAKWKQVTLHLGIGKTHSCHHPSAHKIPLEELQKNPSALHNTNFKKQQRKLMLEGKRPSECDYCWRVEDSKKEDVVYSDRITKSADQWARPFLEEVSSLPWDANVNPSYLEVDFDTTCNFKCAYCMPSYSTTWQQEIKQHGPYKLTGATIHDLDYLKSTNSLPILQSDHNPYIDAFWEWWPDAVKDLQVFRITGGEPLLSKNTFKVLDYLIENPQPQMEFNVNTNLGIPDNILDTFIEKMQIIQKNKCVKSFKLYTSNEAHGKQAEFIRFGLVYDKWFNNCHRVLSEIPDSYLTIMAAFNVLSIPSFKRFMDDVISLKNTYTIQPTRPHPVSLDVPYVRWPEFLAPWVAPVEFLPLIQECVTYAYRNIQHVNWFPLCGKSFHEYEVNRIERLFYVVRDQMNEIHSDSNKINLLRKQFKEYITEYDRRRGTNFLETFPEYETFFKNID